MGHLILLRPLRGVSVSATPHLSIDDAASFVDGTLPDEARAGVERHLAECDSCREEVAASSRLLATLPAPVRRRFPWRLALPLAAGILAVVVLRRPAQRTDVAPARERGAPTDASHIVLVAPAPDAALASDASRFVWHPMAGSIGYRMVIKDASGAPVWSGDAADTVLVLPAEVHLRAGESYVWRVDGQRADGTTASSAEASFQVAR
jgi:hypothetical protein